jgi:hypothetical protein
MKIQCNVCEAAEANVLCCADEAALCYGCDEQVHAANKLATKHQRVSLTNSSSPMPKCDICQEAVGFFFCLEDRALLCRKCDVAIHSINTHVSAHQRFLLTGVKVGLETTEHSACPSSEKSQSIEKVPEKESHPSSRKDVQMSFVGQPNKGLPMQVADNSDVAATKLPYTGGSASGCIQQWQLDDIFGLHELNQTYGFLESDSSKADSGKLGDSDCSPILRTGELELDGDEYLGQVPEAAWAVPEIPSPPTASGLYWPNGYQHQMDAAPAFVPDVCSSIQNPYHYQPNGSTLKRRRQF